MRKKFLLLMAAIVVFTNGCVVLRQDQQTPQNTAARRTEGEIPLFSTPPDLRDYRELTRYEAVGSNITSFNRVLTRLKRRAERDGCDALVKVRFYRQAIGTGRRAASFPTVEAVGIRYVHENSAELRTHSSEKTPLQMR
jgi:hypothetical protein